MYKKKVAYCQRILPHYRVPVFKDLASRENIDLTVFYGEGLPTGSQTNSAKIEGFKHKKLFTIKLNYKGVYGSQQLRVLHPSLFFHLILGRFDVVITEPSTNFYNDIFIFLYCKIFRKKFIWHESGSVPRNERPLYRRIIDPVIDIFIKNSNAFVTYTSYADESLIRDYKIERRKIFRAQNTVDISKIDEEVELYQNQVLAKKEELGLTGYNVALYIGGIEIRKKITNLTKAVANLNQSGHRIKTLIVGDGPDKDKMLQQMSDQEKQLTVFAGKHIEDATLYLLLSDVVVLPSAGGLSVIQAFACGRPFIGSEEIEHGGIKDYVDHGINGFLVKEDNIDDLKNHLSKLFSDQIFYETLCRNAYSKSKSLTVHKMVDGIENAINYVLKDKK